MMELQADLMGAWLRIRCLVRKEVLAILKDPANRVILMVPVLVQTMLFGYAATFDLNHVPYAVLNESHGQASADLLARMDASRVFVRAADVHSVDEMKAVVRRGDALLVLHMASDFDARLAAGHTAKLQLVLDGRNSTTAGMAAGHLGNLIAQFNATLPGVTAPRVSVEQRAWFNSNLVTRWNIVPALLAALSMIQTMIIAALSVAREREQGTFDQLLVTPLRPTEIMIGKALPAILIGVGQATLVLGVSVAWFGIPLQGSLLLLYVGLLSFSTASVGIGLSISALSLNMQQAMVYAFVTLMPLMMLSGFVTPVRNMPEVLQVMTMADPLRFAIDLVRRVYLEGAGWGDVAGDFLPMLMVSAVTLPMAAWLFRHRLA